MTDITMPLCFVHVLPESIGSVPMRPGKAVTSVRGGALVCAAHAPLASLAGRKGSTEARARRGLPSDPGYNEFR